MCSCYVSIATGLVTSLPMMSLLVTSLPVSKKNVKKWCMKGYVGHYSVILIVRMGYDNMVPSYDNMVPNSHWRLTKHRYTFWGVSAYHLFLGMRELHKGKIWVYFEH